MAECTEVFEIGDKVFCLGEWLAEHGTVTDSKEFSSGLHHLVVFDDGGEDWVPAYLLDRLRA